MTIMVCTRERPERLDACLKSLLAQDYPNFSVLVVDNAPLTNRSKSVVDQLDSEAIEYIVEPRKGLCRARNRAIDMVGEGIVASIDDDEIADPHWLTELARGFYDHPEADAVAGIMVPAELETWAQVWFEQYGGFNKQRGFIPAVFSPATAQVQSPLYPLPPFGSGGSTLPWGPAPRVWRRKTRGCSPIFCVWEEQSCTNRPPSPTTSIAGRWKSCGFRCSGMESA